MFQLIINKLGLRKSEVPIYLYVEEYHHSSCQNYQKTEIQSREEPYVFKGLALDVRGIFTEGNKACEGRNKRSHTADVYTY